MLRNRTFLSSIASMLFGILGIWLWVWAPSVVNALSLTVACLLLLYLYAVRFVVPLVKTNKFQFSVFDVGLFVLASVLLVAHRRAPDALVAMAAWPCTFLMFSFHSANSLNTSGTRRKLFSAHLSFFVLAMILSALFSFWQTTQWPIYYDRPFEPPVYEFMLAPAVLTMMAIQRDLSVNYLHPSLLLGVLVSVAVAAITATMTSWGMSAIVDKIWLPNQSSVYRDAENSDRTKR